MNKYLGFILVLVNALSNISIIIFFILSVFNIFLFANFWLLVPLAISFGLGYLTDYLILKKDDNENNLNKEYFSDI